MLSDENVYTGKSFPGTWPASQSNDYPEVSGIDKKLFVLTADQMDGTDREKALAQMKNYINTQAEKFLGYQVNNKLNYSATLSEYLDKHVNNIGDPFTSGNFTVNSKFAERAVLDYFASLWNAKWPHNASDGDSYWGYVLSMGSSEGNIYAMWNARDYLAGRYLLVDPEKKPDNADAHGADGARHHHRHRRYRHFDAAAPEGNPRAFTPLAFFSDNTHYSIIKNTRILNIPTFAEEAAQRGYRCPLIPGTSDYPEGYYEGYIDKNGWPPYVPSNEDGSIYIPALVRLVDFFSAKGYPVLVSFNYGSTFKGALDNVGEAAKKVIAVLKRNGMDKRTIVYDPEKGLTDTRTGYWLHVDGALGAGYVPFLRRDNTFNLPEFDFSIPELHSIIMSGHKWLGAPWPCGIFMSKVKYQLKPVSNPTYIGSPDSTFSGSRNGFSSMLLWDLISRNSADDFMNKAKAALERADKFMERFEKEVAQKHKDLDLWLGRTENSLTIHFRRPNERIVYDYSLSNETLHVGDEVRNYSHIFVMDHADDTRLGMLITALASEDAFKEVVRNAVPGMFAAEEGYLVDGMGLGFR